MIICKEANKQGRNLVKYAGFLAFIIKYIVCEAT